MSKKKYMGGGLSIDSSVAALATADASEGLARLREQRASFEALEWQYGFSAGQSHALGYAEYQEIRSIAKISEEMDSDEELDADLLLYRIAQHIDSDLTADEFGVAYFFEAKPSVALMQGFANGVANIFNQI